MQLQRVDQRLGGGGVSFGINAALVSDEEHFAGAALDGLDQSRRHHFFALESSDFSLVVGAGVDGHFIANNQFNIRVEDAVAILVFRRDGAIVHPRIHDDQVPRQRQSVGGHHLLGFVGAAYRVEDFQLDFALGKPFVFFRNRSHTLVKR